MVVWKGDEKWWTVDMLTSTNHAFCPGRNRSNPIEGLRNGCGSSFM